MATAILTILAQIGAAEWHYIAGGGTRKVSALNFTSALDAHDLTVLCFYDPRSESSSEVGDSFAEAARIVGASRGWSMQTSSEEPHPSIAWSNWSVDALDRVVALDDAVFDAETSATPNVRSVLFATIDVSVDNYIMEKFAPQLQGGFQGDFKESDAFRFGRPSFFPMVITAFVRPPPFPTGERGGGGANGAEGEGELEALFGLNYTADAHPTEWDVLQRRWGLYSAEFDGTFSADAIARFAMRYGRNGLRRRRATELARQMQRRARALRAGPGNDAAAVEVAAAEEVLSRASPSWRSELERSGGSGEASTFDRAHSFKVFATRDDALTGLRLLTNNLATAAIVGCFPPIDRIAPRGVNSSAVGALTLGGESDERLRADLETHYRRQVYASRRNAFKQAAGALLSTMDSAIITSLELCRAVAPDASAASLIVLLPDRTRGECRSSSRTAKAVAVRDALCLTTEVFDLLQHVPHGVRQYFRGASLESDEEERVLHSRRFAAANLELLARSSESGVVGILEAVEQQWPLLPLALASSKGDGERDGDEAGSDQADLDPAAIERASLAIVEFSTHMRTAVETMCTEESDRAVRWTMQRMGVSVVAELTPDNSYTFLNRAEPILILLLNLDDRAEEQERYKFALARAARQLEKYAHGEAQRSVVATRVQPGRVLQLAWADGMSFGGQFDLDVSNVDHLPAVAVIWTKQSFFTREVSPHRHQMDSEAPEEELVGDERRFVLDVEEEQMMRPFVADEDGTPLRGMGTIAVVETVVRFLDKLDTTMPPRSSNKKCNEMMIRSECVKFRGDAKACIKCYQRGAKAFVESTCAEVHVVEWCRALEPEDDDAVESSQRKRMEEERKIWRAKWAQSIIRKSVNETKSLTSISNQSAATEVKADPGAGAGADAGAGVETHAARRLKELQKEMKEMKKKKEKKVGMEQEAVDKGRVLVDYGRDLAIYRSLIRQVSELCQYYLRETSAEATTTTTECDGSSSDDTCAVDSTGSTERAEAILDTIAEHLVQVHHVLEPRAHRKSKPRASERGDIKRICTAEASKQSSSMLSGELGLLVDSPATLRMLLGGNESTPSDVAQFRARLEERAKLMAALQQSKMETPQHSRLMQKIQRRKQKLLIILAQMRVAMERIVVATTTTTTKGGNATTSTMLSIPIEDASSLSMERFVREYALRMRPVIIRGQNMTKKPWNLAHIDRMCGAKKASLVTRRSNVANTAWGGLASAEVVPKLSDFLHTFNTSRRTLYLHDWTLATHCPAIFGAPPFNEFAMPKYFASDYFQRVFPNGYTHSWPSLFVGAANTSSKLHVDSGATNFWMYLNAGTKEWRFFDHLEKVPYLYRRLGQSVGFEVDTFHPDPAQFPLLGAAKMYRAVQEAGDLIFIPGGSPHAVHNHDDIVALAMNYLDDSNYWLYLFDQLFNQNWQQLEFFTEPSFPLGFSSNQSDVTFGRFKSTEWRNLARDLDLRAEAVSARVN